jgi:hypothetical protein
VVRRGVAIMDAVIPGKVGTGIVKFSLIFFDFVTIVWGGSSHRRRFKRNDA